MSEVKQFPQKKTNDYTSLMTLLECGDCHEIWIGLYEHGVEIKELHCPSCEGTNLTSRQGERQIVFYDYSGG